MAVDTDRHDRRNMSAYLLAKKRLDGQDRAFLFMSDSANVLFALKKRNALGLT